MGPGRELFWAVPACMRACLARGGRRMRTEEQMHGYTHEVGSCVLVASLPKIASISFLKSCLSAAWRVPGKQLYQATPHAFCCERTQMTFSTSHQVTAKSFWQQRGAHIRSEGEDHSVHLTPCGPALWETDVGAKWDRPWHGGVFFHYVINPTEPGSSSVST